MAIDPVTAKTVVKIGAKLATTEDGRKVILIAVLVPIFIVLLIILLFVYILSSPLSFIAGFFVSSEERAAVKEFKAEYKDAVRLSTGQTVLNGKYPMPLIGEITSYYGERIHPITGKLSEHTGIDIAGAWHEEVISIADGQVIDLGIDHTYGQYVLIKHELPDETFYTFYAHLSTVFVIHDQEVFVGDVIGLEGGDPEKDPIPGLSTGHHLHFEIRTERKASSHVDPVPYLYASSEVDEDEDPVDPPPIRGHLP